MKPALSNRLYSRRFASATIPTLSTAFQFAVREIVSETGPTPAYAAFDLASGSFSN